VLSAAHSSLIDQKMELEEGLASPVASPIASDGEGEEVIPIAARVDGVESLLRRRARPKQPSTLPLMSS
jgi:hypothetical protein